MRRRHGAVGLAGLRVRAQYPRFWGGAKRCFCVASVLETSLKVRTKERSRLSPILVMKQREMTKATMEINEK